MARDAQVDQPSRRKIWRPWVERRGRPKPSFRQRDEMGIIISSKAACQRFHRWEGWISHVFFFFKKNLGLYPTHTILSLKLIKKAKKKKRSPTATTLVAGINPKKTALQNIKDIVNYPLTLYSSRLLVEYTTTTGYCIWFDLIVLSDTETVSDAITVMLSNNASYNSSLKKY